jgi:putative heme iron utilization protein
MTENELAALREFLREHRQAVLAVSANDEPFTAMTAYVAEPALHSALIYLSNLSPHKRILLNNPKCSLLIAEPDDGRAEVMSLARVTLQGTAAKIDKDTPDYAEAKALYLAALPASELMFGLPDFDLIRITFTSGRYIAGFGRAFPFAAADL